MNESVRPKLMMAVPLPPPYHGASIMSRHLTRSETLRRAFDIKVVPLRFARDISELGKFSLKKLFLAVRITFKLIRELFFHKPALYYAVVSPRGFSRYRDLVWIVLARMAGVSRVIHLREKGFVRSDRKRRRILLNRLLFHGTWAVVLSQAMAEQASAYVTADRIFAVPNGLPDIEKVSIPEKRGNCVRLLFLSNFLLQKGIVTLFKAISILNRAETGDFRLVMAGGWSRNFSETLCHKMLNEFGIAERVEIRGPVYGEDKLKLMNSADIFIFPSEKEAFGNVVLEAMRSKVAVIASNEGSLPFILDQGRAGMIFPKGDPLVLCAKISRLIADRDLRRSLGELGRQRFEQLFTLKKYENSMKCLFESVVSQKNVK